VSRGAHYARFIGLAAGIVVILMAAGYLPTQRLAGDAAVPAMAAGCLISFAAAALAGWLLVTAGGSTPTAKMQRAFLAMVVRLAVVVVFGLSAALSGVVARMPLLFWLATAYVALLPLEVKLAVEEP
jgi:hypothetical protein